MKTVPVTQREDGILLGPDGKPVVLAEGKTIDGKQVRIGAQVATMPNPHRTP